MLDESIESSPRKGNRSIRHARVHRKIKRRDAEDEMDSILNNIDTLPVTAPTKRQQIESDTESFPAELAIADLSLLYEFQTGIQQNTSKRISTDFDPFTEERLLLLADRVKPTLRSPINMRATQGFLPSDSELFNSSYIDKEKPNTDYAAPDVKHTIDFEITDSELLQVCEENDQRTTNVVSGKESCSISKETPQCYKSKSIVDMILEDFCCSPMSPEAQSSEDSMFCFRYANKSIRTYGRTKCHSLSARQNIAAKFEHNPIEDDALSTDSSSGLSIQEDNTLVEIPAASEIIDIQNSQNICENLRNLSAYFTKISQKDQSSEHIDEEPDLGHTTEVSSVKYSSNENIVASLLEKNKDETNESATKCLSVLQGKPHSRSQSPETMDSSVSLSLLEEFHGFPSDMSDGDCSENSTQINNFTVKAVDVRNENCDRNVKDDGGGKIDYKEELFFDDDYEWTDECDFFTNHNHFSALLEPGKCSKIETTSGKTTTMSKNVNNISQNLVQPSIYPDQTNIITLYSPKKAASDKSFEEKVQYEHTRNILHNLPQLCANESVLSDNCLPVNNKLCKENNLEKLKTTSTNISEVAEEPKVQIFHDLPQISMDEIKTENICARFKTASSKPINISKEAQQRAARILENLPQLTTNDDLNDNCHLPKVHNSSNSFAGFKTASNKAINISKEAEERVAKIFDNLPQLTTEDETDRLCSLTTDKSQGSAFVGFKTASSKPINISKEAQERAAKILENLPQLTTEEKTADICLFTKDHSSGRAFAGFQTASSKSIIVSKEAQERAAKIFENIPTDGEIILEDLRNMSMENGYPLMGNTKEITPDDAKKQNVETDLLTHGLNDIVFSEWFIGDDNLESKNTDMPCEISTDATAKRKVANTDFENEEISAIKPSKLICKSPNASRSPLKHLQNGIVHSSLSELAIKTPPNYRSSSAIISRKNLLSLNRRNKAKEATVAADTDSSYKSACAETPTKRSKKFSENMLNNKRETNSPLQTPPGTPTLNLQEFFKSAPINTSTPNPQPQVQTRMRTRSQKNVALQVATTPVTELEMKPINWEHENVMETPHCNKSKTPKSYVCDSNITFMESHPTPKQRIARLRMYGKPPALSPVFMSSNNNCRISGLKRSNRSFVKQ